MAFAIASPPPISSCQAVSQANRAMTRWGTHAGYNSSEKRLARLLLLLANFGKNGKPTPIDASINQATLAEMIGTTRSRTSFFLNKFRKLGLISYNGKIEVHRSLLNAVLYEKPQLERDEKPT
jgi:CRP-like cAMP-binding protein